ncbi:MAG TPA: AAA family ATPase, partial [Verrucomicrobiae bacterium]|nr:AAA family ATPase [Verrucomicrobiae bacterium]
MRGRNKPGEQCAAQLGTEPALLTNPTEALMAFMRAEEESIIFFHNAQLWLDNPSVIQAIWNLRDSFKARRCSLVLLGPDITLPQELRNDVITIEEPAPTETDIDRVISKTAEDAKVALNGEKTKAIDTLLGYGSEFAVEQAFALSLNKKGVNLDKLWDLKVRDLRKAAGLEVSLPKENFNDLAGCEGFKEFMRMYLNGRKRPRCEFWLDEIEKMVGGTGDTSGVSQGLIEQFLNWTQERRVDGMLLIGVPGAGKSASCKTTAGEARIPLLRGSMSTVKGSLVGQSEGQFKALL